MQRMNGTIRYLPAKVKEGPADCIGMAEVRAVLKKMKRHKAPGLSGLVAQMIQHWNNNNNNNNNNHLTAICPKQPG